MAHSYVINLRHDDPDPTLAQWIKDEHAQFFAGGTELHAIGQCPECLAVLQATRARQTASDDNADHQAHTPTPQADTGQHGPPADTISHYCFTPLVERVPCPCYADAKCPGHRHVIGHQYWAVLANGERIELSKHDYDRRMK